jgi:phosphohistidine phosphatase SixA
MRHYYHWLILPLFSLSFVTFIVFELHAAASREGLEAAKEAAEEGTPSPPPKLAPTVPDDLPELPPDFTSERDPDEQPPSYISPPRPARVTSLAADLPADSGFVPKMTPSRLVRAMQAGGYVVFMRHAHTDDTQAETRVNLTDCNSQINLSEQGKQYATNIALAIKQLNIPVGIVYSSPYCRCMDTATIALGHAQALSELSFLANLRNEQQRQDYATTLRNMLAQIPSDGDNTFIVSHSVNLQQAIGLHPKPEGIMQVFKPNGQDFEYIGAIHPDFWTMFIR